MISVRRAAVVGIATAAAACAARAAIVWIRYGHPSAPADPAEADPLLDRFLPQYEVVERHHIRVAAPPEVAFATACEMALLDAPSIRAIFRTRAIILGERGNDAGIHRLGTIEYMKSIGWAVLAQLPAREIVMGAVTQPWQPDVVFRGLPPEQFVAFNRPEFVKIAWMLRMDPAGPGRSVVRTETRVETTCPVARAKFRLYWALFSPGIIVIRWLLLRQLRANLHMREN